MSPHTLHTWSLQTQGCLHVLQGWLMRDVQCTLQGRYQILSAQLERLQGRVSAAPHPLAMGRAELSS